jgi:hypothetical protein
MVWWLERDAGYVVQGLGQTVFVLLSRDGSPRHRLRKMDLEKGFEEDEVSDCQY